MCNITNPNAVEQGADRYIWNKLYSIPYESSKLVSQQNKWDVGCMLMLDIKKREERARRAFSSVDKIAKYEIEQGFTCRN